MNIDDFRSMRQGKTMAFLSNQHSEWLKPVAIHHGVKNKRALLLLHGFSSSPAVYRELLPTLSTLYDGIVCPALPGHATTLTEFAQVQAHQWVSAAEEACTDLTEKYESVDVMGLSLGGLLACHLAKRFDLNHLYLLAPALTLKMNISLALGLAKVLRTLGFKTLRNRAGNLYTLRFAEIAYRQLPITTIIEILTLISEFELEPPTCPVDVFLGQYDEVIASPHVAEVFDKMPNAKIHWLENSAHVLPLDGDIDTIIACIKKNLQPVKTSAAK